MNTVENVSENSLPYAQVTWKNNTDEKYSYKSGNGFKL